MLEGVYFRYRPLCSVITSLLCICVGVSNAPPMRAHCATGHIVTFVNHTCTMAEQESKESVTPKPAKKRKCLSLSRKKKTLSPSRFSTMVGDDEVSSMSKGYVPPNTQKNTALKNFETWRDQRNAKVSCDDERCPLELLSTTDAALLTKWLCLFINETRRSDGTLYPPKTLYQLLCGLLSLFSCSNGATFSCCPSGNVVINVTPNVTGFAVKELESTTSVDQTL